MRPIQFLKVLACCLVLFVGLNSGNRILAQGNVFVSQAKGYTIESLGTYSQGQMISALDQGEWESYRKATLPVTLTFDDGSVVTLHSASSRPNPQMTLAIPDQTVIAARTLSIAPSGAILMLHTSQLTK